MQRLSSTDFDEKVRGNEKERNVSKFMLSDMPVGFSNIVKYEWLEYTVRICIDVGRISETNTDGNNEGVQSSGLDFKGQIGLLVI